MDVQKKNSNEIRELSFSNDSPLEEKMLVVPVKPHDNWRSLSYWFGLCGEGLPWPESQGHASLLANLPLLFLTLAQQKQGGSLLSWYRGLVSRSLIYSGGFIHSRASAISKYCVKFVFVSRLLSMPRTYPVKAWLLSWWVSCFASIDLSGAAPVGSTGTGQGPTSCATHCSIQLPGSQSLLFLAPAFRLQFYAFSEGSAAVCPTHFQVYSWLQLVSPSRKVWICNLVVIFI